MKKKILFFICFCFFWVSCSHAKTYKVALFIPVQTPFWTLVANFMQEVANDLKIDLRVYDAQSNHILMIDQVKKAISGPDKVDAVVFQNFKNRAPLIIQLGYTPHSCEIKR